MTPTVACVGAFMLDSFLLRFFSLGDVGLIIDSTGVTNAFNPPAIASFYLTNSCNLWTLGFSAFGSIEQT